MTPSAFASNSLSASKPEREIGCDSRFQLLFGMTHDEQQFHCPTINEADTWLPSLLTAE